MDEVYTYQITVDDGMDEEMCNATSPYQFAVLNVTPVATRLSVQSDQAGLIGLLRHLHQQGYVLLSVTREGRERLIGGVT